MFVWWLGQHQVQCAGQIERYTATVGLHVMSNGSQLCGSGGAGRPTAAPPVFSLQQVRTFTHVHSGLFLPLSLLLCWPPRYIKDKRPCNLSAHTHTHTAQPSKLQVCLKSFYDAKHIYTYQKSFFFSSLSLLFFFFFKRLSYFSSPPFSISIH